MTDTDHQQHYHHPNRSPPPPKPPDHTDRRLSISDSPLSATDCVSTETNTSTATETTITSLTDPSPPRDTTPDSTMLATQLPSAIGGHMFSSPLAQKTPQTIQMELQQLKAAPILNPHFRMVQR